MDFYADLGIPYPFTIELPDLGDFGMLLPPADIIEVILLVSLSSFSLSLSLDLPLFNHSFTLLLTLSLSSLPPPLSLSLSYTPSLFFPLSFLLFLTQLFSL